MFMFSERNYPGEVSGAGGDSSLKCLSVKYCLCMQGENVSSLIFNMLSVKCMISSFSVIQRSHVVGLFLLWLSIIDPILGRQL